MDINIDIDEEVFLPCYRHLLTDKNNLKFLWGGRDSGKSFLIAEKLLIDCLTKPYFRCILIKKTFESIKDAQWQTLKDIAIDWGVDHLFDFKVSPLEIVCQNGNKFIARGCDKPEKLKSISNPSHAWYEEGNQLTENDYIIASTTLRSNQGEVEEWFSFNPECEGNYEEFWLYRYFFAGYKGQKNFQGSIQVKLLNDEETTVRYSSTHTTYHDNPYCSPQRIARHEALKATNEYYYKVFTLGEWGNKEVGFRFYKPFNRGDHVKNRPYDSTYPLHISFDENVNPYLPLVICQVKGKEFWVADVILGRDPYNTLDAVCDAFSFKYRTHKSGLDIYGDATSDKEDVKQQKGDNLFTLAANRLSKFKPRVKVPRSNPGVITRRDFIRDVMAHNYGGISFYVYEALTEVIAEYENVREAPDGRKEKKNEKDPESKISYQRWGHISDAVDYAFCQIFAAEFERWQRGDKPITITIGKKNSKNSW